MRAKIGGLLRRTVNRLRGSQNVESLIAAGMELGEGGMVLDRSYIDPGRPWLVRIGGQVGVSSYVKVLTHDDRMRIQTGLTRIAPVEIEDRVFIGGAATILPGTHIGADSIIAGGAVVSGEIPAGSLVAGHPARVITTVGRLLEWQRRAAEDAPVWPREGWTRRGGITEEHKAIQREALATVREGYLQHKASRHPGSTRSRRARLAATWAATELRGIRPRALKRRIASRMRGNRSIERHLREGLQLGERAFVADEAFLDPGHTWLITIGDDSFISPYVFILTHDSGLYYQGGLHRIGRVDIGSRVYVGPGAVILPGSQIGDGSIIEAGAVVRGAIPPESYAAGNPATVVSDTASILEDNGSSNDSGLSERSGTHKGPRSGPSAGRFKRRLVGKLRGEHTLEQLVVEGLELGEGASVARRAYLDPAGPWLLTIGEESIISDFAIVMTHDQRTKALVGTTRLGRVAIGRRVFVGPGAIILPGTRIGEDSVIDARAVVSGEIAPGSFVSGNPGRVVANVEAMADEWRKSATTGPTWPYEGWSSEDGITLDQKRSQRRALAEASEGYVRARAGRGT